MVSHDSCMPYRQQRSTEAQRSGSRHGNQHPLALASLAQPRQKTNAAPMSVSTGAGQYSHQPPQLQQQRSVSFTLTAADAQSSSDRHEHADTVDLDVMPQQPSSDQLSPNPASSHAHEQSASVEQACLLPGQGGGRAMAGVHCGVMGDEMCDPMELTWEEVLEAASGNHRTAADGLGHDTFNGKRTVILITLTVYTHHGLLDITSRAMVRACITSLS